MSKKRARVLLAKPSMFMVPRKLVLIVLMGLYLHRFGPDKDFGSYVVHIYKGQRKKECGIEGQNSLQAIAVDSPYRPTTNITVSYTAKRVPKEWGTC